MQLASLSRGDLDSGDFDGFVRFQSHQSQDVRGFDLPALVLNPESGRSIIVVVAWNIARGPERPISVMIVPNAEMGDLFRSTSISQLDQYQASPMKTHGNTPFSGGNQRYKRRALLYLPLSADLMSLALAAASTSLT